MVPTDRGEVQPSAGRNAGRGLLFLLMFNLNNR